jgi:hypothetical protein
MGRCTSRNGPIPINQISVVAATAIAKFALIEARQPPRIEPIGSL